MLPVEKFFRCSAEWHENKAAHAFIGKNDLAVHFFSASFLVPESLSIRPSSVGLTHAKDYRKMELRVISTCCNGPIVILTEKELQLVRLPSALREWCNAPRHLHIYDTGKKEKMLRVDPLSSSLEIFSSSFLLDQIETLDLLLSRAHLPSCQWGGSALHCKHLFPGQSFSLSESPMIRAYCSALSVVQTAPKGSSSAAKEEISAQRTSSRYTLPRGWSTKKTSDAALRLHQSFFPSSSSFCFSGDNDQSEDEGRDDANESHENQPSIMEKLIRPWKLVKTTLNSRSITVFSNPLVDAMNEDGIYHPLLFYTTHKNEGKRYLRDDNVDNKIPSVNHCAEKEEEEEFRLSYLLAHLIVLHGFELVANQPFLSNWPLGNSEWFANHHFRCRYCGAHPKVDLINSIKDMGDTRSHSPSLSAMKSSTAAPPSSLPVAGQEPCDAPKSLTSIDSASLGSTSAGVEYFNTKDKVILQDSNPAHENAFAKGEDSFSSPPTPTVDSLSQASFSFGVSHLEERNESATTSSPTPSHAALTLSWKKEYNSHCSCCPWNTLFLDRVLGPTVSHSCGLQPSSIPALNEVTLYWKNKSYLEKNMIMDISSGEKSSNLGMREEKESKENTTSTLCAPNHTLLTFYFDSKELGYLLSAFRFRQELLESAGKMFVKPLECTYPLNDVMKNGLFVRDCIPMIVDNEIESETNGTCKSGQGNNLATPSSGFRSGDELLPSCVLSRADVEEFLRNLNQTDQKKKNGANERLSLDGEESKTGEGDCTFAPCGENLTFSPQCAIALGIRNAAVRPSNVEYLTQLIWETMQPFVSFADPMGEKASTGAFASEAEKRMLELASILLNEEEKEEISLQGHAHQSASPIDIMNEFESKWNELENIYAKDEEKEARVEDRRVPRQSDADDILRHTYEAILRLGPLFVKTDAVKDSLSVYAPGSLGPLENSKEENNGDIAHPLPCRELDSSSQVLNKATGGKMELAQGFSSPPQTQRKRARSSDRQKLSHDPNAYLFELESGIKQYRAARAKKITSVVQQNQEEISRRNAHPAGVSNKTDAKGIPHGSGNDGEVSAKKDAGKEPLHQHSFSSSIFATSPAPVGGNSLFFPISSISSREPKQSQLPLPHSPLHTAKHSYQSDNESKNTTCPGVTPPPLPGHSSSYYTSAPPFPSQTILSTSAYASPPPAPRVVPGSTFSSSSTMGTRSSGFPSIPAGSTPSRPLGPVLRRQPAPSILGAGHPSVGSPGPGKSRGGGRGDGPRSGATFHPETVTHHQGGGKFKSLPSSAITGSVNSGRKGSVRRGGGIGVEGNNAGLVGDTSYNTSNISTNPGSRSGRGVGFGRGGRGQRGNRGGGSWKNRGD